ncbi:MAG: aldehyde ferredoxin oxidoreductase family protein [Anaerolineae bacterium]|nr:aldehyde ferredoxin oxidoreductase family protein [Anaerolineae bacterium]
MPFGYHGKILHVKLSELSYEVEEPPEEFYRKYFGGSALGAYYLLKNTPVGADPFGPENTLTLALSVVTGAPVSGQSRMTAVAKSPLTDAVGDSQSGGFFPAEMKFAGYDAIVIRGKAETPVYLWIKDGEVEIRSAEHLWGLTTDKAEDQLKEELEDEKIEVLQIGPAGENLVRYAAIMNMVNRANGRTGMGAVMGSKNLKAVVVRGKMRPKLAAGKELNALAKWGADRLPDSDVITLSKLGTSHVMEYQNKKGGQVTRNWDSGFFEGWPGIDGKTMAKTILKDRETCYACTIRCKRVVEIEEGPYKVERRFGGPEYETLSTFGSYCAVDDLAAVSYANKLCAMHGMDTMSCGATIAWAMDCFEQGLLTEEDTDGFELRYGDAEAMVKMVEMIAKRQGFGAVLAEGSARAAEKIGKGTEELVVAVKKQEMPAHMPQVKRSMGLIYAVNPFGADHQSHEHDQYYPYYGERLSEIGLTTPVGATEMNREKVEYALVTQYMYSFLDTINICQFVFGPTWHLYGPSQLVEMVQKVTGWDVTLDELMQAGERRLNMLRAFNAREGFGREDDRLPKKLYKTLTGGKTDGAQLEEGELEAAKDMYYEMAGWEVSSGIPSKGKLEELGLEWLAEELHG